MNKSTSIQALRGLAFLSIFIYHAGLIPSGGSLGVSIFFVLSGFLLMCRSNEQSMVSSPLRNLKYSCNHIKKLYPLHLVMTVVALPLLFHTWWDHTNAALNIGARVGVNVLLIQSWFPWESIRYSMNNLSWFLCCMVFLYFMFPMIHNWIVKIRDVRKKIALSLGIWALMWILGYLANYFVGQNGLSPSFCQGLTYNFPIYRLGDFFIGCIAGSVYKQTDLKLSKKVYTIIEAVVLAVSIAFVLINWSGIVLESLGRRFWESVPALIPLSIIIVVLFMKCGGGITQFLSKTIFVKLGNISGEAFLIHELPMTYMAMIIIKLRIGSFGMNIVKAVIGFAITLFAVWIWHKIIRIVDMRKNVQKKVNWM